MKTLLSIVVPTKNRYKYLKHLINLIDSFKSDEIELVIQDNSDNNDEITQYLNVGIYPNVKYFYSSEKLSMSGNSDAAVLNSRGEYVCFIGDDDGVCRNIVDCARWMKENDIDIIKSSKVVYYWEDYNKKKLRDNLSQTIVYKQPKIQYYNSDPILELKKVLKIGFQDKLNLPFLYTGIVKRSVLDEVYKIGNTYFPGGSPDMSNGVSLCFFAKKMAIIDIPVVITGISNMTGGGILRRKGEISTLENVGFINQSVIDNWENNIPRIWEARFVWPESGIKALRYVHHEEFISEMNYDYMFANFSIYHLKNIKIAFSYSQDKLKYIYHLIQLLIKNSCRVLKNKIVALFVNRANGLMRQDNITDIIEAEKFLMNTIKNVKFENLVFRKK